MKNINNESKLVYVSNKTIVERGDHNLIMQVACRRQIMDLYAKVSTEDVNQEVKMEKFELTTYGVMIQVEVNGEIKAEDELVTGLTHHSAIKSIGILSDRDVSLDQVEYIVEDMANGSLSVSDNIYENLFLVFESMLEKEHLPNEAEFNRIKISGIRSYIKKNKKDLVSATYKPNSVFLLKEDIVKEDIVA